MQSRSTSRAQSDSMAAGSVGKERRGREGNWMISFPIVEATAAAVGDAWKYSRVKKEAQGFRIMTPAFCFEMWRAKTSVCTK